MHKTFKMCCVPAVHSQTFPNPGDITKQEVNSSLNDSNSIMVLLTGKVREFEQVLTWSFRLGSRCWNCISCWSTNPVAGTMKLPVMNFKTSDSESMISLSPSVVKSNKLLLTSFASIASNYREKLKASPYALLLLPWGENSKLKSSSNFSRVIWYLYWE